MTIEKIREDIHNNVGNVAVITHNEGRNKIYEYMQRIIYINIYLILFYK